MVSPPSLKPRDGVVVGFVEKLILNLVDFSKKEGKAEKYAFAHFLKMDGNFRNFQKGNLLFWLVSGHNNSSRLGSFSGCRISRTLAFYINPQALRRFEFLRRKNLENVWLILCFQRNNPPCFFGGFLSFLLLLMKKTFFS